MSTLETFDAVVVGGGPAGATAAGDLAKMGHTVLLLDRAGRIKPYQRSKSLAWESSHT